MVQLRVPSNTRRMNPDNTAATTCCRKRESISRSRPEWNKILFATAFAVCLLPPFAESFPKAVIISTRTHVRSSRGLRTMPIQNGRCSSRAEQSHAPFTAMRLKSINEADAVEERELEQLPNLHASTEPTLDHSSGNNITYLDDNFMPVTNGFTQPKNGRKERKIPERQWARRHARSVQEGIRREKSESSSYTKKMLSTILDQTKKQFSSNNGKAEAVTETRGKRYAARTISGLITALAEEAVDLEVDVDARKDTHFWSKEIEEVRINFARLGFAPLRISGLDSALRNLESLRQVAKSSELSAVSCADEAFDRIDVDKSGSLDIEEIAQALNGAAAATPDDTKLLEGLASQLVNLYDVNGDGVVDREEYQSMVEDMASLREAQKESEKEKVERERARLKQSKTGWRGKLLNAVPFLNDRSNSTKASMNNMTNALTDELDSLPKGEGSIVLSDVKLDLRRLVFGGVPLLKKITPGGPLILEPFTATVSGSFNSEDVMESFLLDSGLRLLVALILKKRVRPIRDFFDGAVFYGRTWKMKDLAAPQVEVPKLTSIEFDKRNRLIITGRAIIRTGPDAPKIEQPFKLRSKLGTSSNGQLIRLAEPELALVIECPKAWERNIVGTCTRLDLPIPERPEPIYSFFPIHSPFKVADNESDGFNLGEDNCIKAVYIKDGALRFEISAVLRPGRFLGNHYLAFTIPNRTFIVTMDRMMNGVRAARQNKKIALEAQRKQLAEAYPEVVPKRWMDDLRFAERRKSKNIKLEKLLRKKSKESRPSGKSFFSRFVEGYQTNNGSEGGAGKRSERLTTAVSDWFGRQGSNSDGEEDVE